MGDPKLSEGKKATAGVHNMLKWQSLIITPPPPLLSVLSFWLFEVVSQTACYPFFLSQCCLILKRWFILHSQQILGHITSSLLALSGKKIQRSWGLDVSVSGTPFSSRFFLSHIVLNMQSHVSKSKASLSVKSDYQITNTWQLWLIIRLYKLYIYI